MVDNRDRCPSCMTHDLGRQAFNEDGQAGDVVQCTSCKVSFAVTSMNNGTEEWFVFERTEQEGADD